VDRPTPLTAGSSETLKPGARRADNNRMAARRWRRAEIEDLVRDRTLYVRDRFGSIADGPAWLRAAAGRISPLDSAQCLGVTHPEDQGDLFGSYVASLERPGELCDTHLRIFLDEHWGHHEIHWLNLLDDPDVGVNICVEYEVPGPAFPAPGEQGATGRHDEANWVLLDVDGAGVITAVTGEPSGTVGHGAEELHGRSVIDFLHADSVGPASLHWLAVKDEPGTARASLRRWVRNDGTDIVLETSYLNPGETPDGAMRLGRNRAGARLARRRCRQGVPAELEPGGGGHLSRRPGGAHQRVHPSAGHTGRAVSGSGAGALQRPLGPSRHDVAQSARQRAERRRMRCIGTPARRMAASTTASARPTKGIAGSPGRAGGT
jgi:hypothetical protein